jgi:hypothetical protein
MLIVDTSAVKLPGEAKQNNLPPECGQPIDVGETTADIMRKSYTGQLIDALYISTSFGHVDLTTMRSNKCRKD